MLQKSLICGYVQRFCAFIPVATVALGVFATPKLINCGVSSETDGEVDNAYIVTAGVSDMPTTAIDDGLIPPVYKGGQAAWMEMLKANLNYPASAKEHGVHGRYFVRFVVDKDGSCNSYEVLDNSFTETYAKVVANDDSRANQKGYITQAQYAADKEALRQEAIRVLKLSSGNWTPGMLNGEAVRVSYTQPITFSLSSWEPTYKGGEAAMMAMLRDNLKYPASANEHGVEGRVYVNFVVDKDGSCDSFETSSSVETSATIIADDDAKALQAGYITKSQFETDKRALEEEALRVAKLMSDNWIPGKYNGEAVRVKYSLPVTFRLK